MTNVDRLARIESKLDLLLKRSASMPTVNGLWVMVATVLGVALSVVSVTTGALALAGIL